VVRTLSDKSALNFLKADFGRKLRDPMGQAARQTRPSPTTIVAAVATIVTPHIRLAKLLTSA
jgi:hypothetical protein